MAFGIQWLNIPISIRGCLIKQKAWWWTCVTILSLHEQLPNFSCANVCWKWISKTERDTWSTSINTQERWRGNTWEVWKQEERSILFLILISCHSSAMPVSGIARLWLTSQSSLVKFHTWLHVSLPVTADFFCCWLNRCWLILSGKIVGGKALMKSTQQSSCFPRRSLTMAENK